MSERQAAYRVKRASGIVDSKSQWEERLHFQIHAAGLPEHEREYRFHDTRKWRFDFAWPVLRIAAEVEGGTWAGGRHTRGDGFAKDCEKYNAAAMAGWFVFRFTSGMIESGEALSTIIEAIKIYG